MVLERRDAQQAVPTGIEGGGGGEANGTADGSAGKEQTDDLPDRPRRHGGGLGGNVNVDRPRVVAVATETVTRGERRRMSRGQQRLRAGELEWAPGVDIGDQREQPTGRGDDQFAGGLVASRAERGRRR